MLESWWMPVFAWAVPWWKRSQTWGWPQHRHQAPSHCSEARLRCLAFLDKVRQYDNSGVLPGTCGNSPRYHKGFCGPYWTEFTLLQMGFCGFFIYTESLCCKEFSMGVDRYLHSDYPWLWLKTAKFCYGLRLWITIEVFACILMTAE